MHKNMIWNVRSKHDPNFAHGANNTKRGLDFGEDSNGKFHLVASNLEL